MQLQQKLQLAMLPLTFPSSPTDRTSLFASILEGQEMLTLASLELQAHCSCVQPSTPVVQQPPHLLSKFEEHKHVWSTATHHGSILGHWRLLQKADTRSKCWCIIHRMPFHKFHKKLGAYMCITQGIITKKRKHLLCDQIQHAFFHKLYDPTSIHAPLLMSPALLSSQHTVFMMQEVGSRMQK